MQKFRQIDYLVQLIVQFGYYISLFHKLELKKDYNQRYFDYEELSPYTITGDNAVQAGAIV